MINSKLYLVENFEDFEFIQELFIKKLLLVEWINYIYSRFYHFIKL